MAQQYGGVVGTGISSPTAFLQNTLDSISQKYIHPSISDIVLSPSTTYWALQRSGKHNKGTELVFPLLTQEEPTGGEFWGDQLLDTSTVDSIQPANQIWRAIYQNVAIPTLDLIISSGSSALSLLKAKMQACAASLLPKLARNCYGVAPNNGPLSIDNIPSWIGTQNNTIAGINRATTTAWNPANTVNVGAAALSPTTVEQGYAAVTFGYDEPDTLVALNTDLSNFKLTFVQPGTTTTSIIRSVDNMSEDKTVQTSLRRHFRYNNLICLNDNYVAPPATGSLGGTYAYMWNSKYMWMNYHPKAYFIIRPWLMASNQEVISSRVIVVMQLTNVNPRTAVAFGNI